MTASMLKIIKTASGKLLRKTEVYKVTLE